ncbi:MAG: tetratricopeptide repeat protein [Asgard group archaeon]|nr:tetratricopeptide repeat protein [Asgard group archaeon]
MKKEQLDETKRWKLKLIMEARSYLHQGLKEKALECYTKLLEENSSDFDALYGIGMLYFEMGENEKALKYLDMILEQKDDHIDALYAKGTILVRLENYKKALKILEKVVLLKPDFYLGWLSIGCAAAALHNYEDALSYFRKVEVLGKEEFVYTEKARIYKNQNKKKLASKFYFKALEVDPFDSEALFGLGELAIQEKDWKKARDYLTKSVIQNEKNIAAWKLLVKVYQQLSDSKREQIAKKRVNLLSKKQ